MQYRYFTISLLVWLFITASGNWCTADTQKNNSFLCYADPPKSDSARRDTGPQKSDSFADRFKDFDPLALQATDYHEALCVYFVSLGEEFNSPRYLEIKHPLDMDVLNPATMNFCTNGASIKKNQNGEIIRLDARTCHTSFEYKKENINGKDYYTGFVIRFLSADGNKELITINCFLTYQTKASIPEAKQLVIVHSSDGRVSSTKDRQLCPQTGKIENCLITSGDSSTYYAFEVNNPPLFEVYFYQKNSGSLSPTGLKRFKNIGGEYKLIELRKDGNTTQYEYYENKNSDRAYYRKVKKATFPDNTAKSYEYFDDGCLKSEKSL